MVVILPDFSGCFSACNWLVFTKNSLSISFVFTFFSRREPSRFFSPFLCIVLPSAGSVWMSLFVEQGDFSQLKFRLNRIWHKSKAIDVHFVKIISIPRRFKKPDSRPISRSRVKAHGTGIGVQIGSELNFVTPLTG